MKRSAENILAAYVDALRPIIYINHFDFHVIDEYLAHIGEDVRIMEYSNALGPLDFRTKRPLCPFGEIPSLLEFLEDARQEGYEKQTFIVLKDIHHELENSPVHWNAPLLSMLERIAEDNLYREKYRCTVFIVSSQLTIPKELENYITIFDVPYPTKEEIGDIVSSFVREMEIHPEQEVLDRLSVSLRGLNEFQIRQILTLAYQDGGCLDAEDERLILKEKEQFIKKSGVLELVNFKESIEDIGGLDNLKNWLCNKAQIFKNLDGALKFGVDIPSGTLIVGMPGCGKSLAAKATAALFGLPLMRLDVGRLLGKYVGDSEHNMRSALRLAEAVSPCVLWIDEVEKAFAGVGGSDGGNGITTRLFGQFLTWMQEKDSLVFVLATANDISALPPEFLRKGRFDEIFFVDLPNEEERRRILEIHLKKRHKWDRGIDTISLIKPTEGFAGADLEAVVKEVIEQAFIRGEENVTTEDLLAIIKDTKSITNTMGEKIKNIRTLIKEVDIKPASLKEGEKGIQRIEPAKAKTKSAAKKAPEAEKAEEKDKTDAKEIRSENSVLSSWLKALSRMS